jgi:hypothetical protein
MAGVANAAEALYHAPRDGHKYELLEGCLIMSPAGMKHEQIGAKLLIALGLYCEITLAVSFLPLALAISLRRTSCSRQMCRSCGRSAYLGEKCRRPSASSRPTWRLNRLAAR